MRINCLIIDDEPLAISILETYIEKLENMVVVNTYTNAIDALQDIKNGDIDVIFLDINMSRITGLDFLRTLKNYPYIIITTAYREYALESYELDVLDYLVKPIPFDRFLKSTNKLTDRLHEKKGELIHILSEPHIFIKIDKRMVKVVLSDILYIESLKDYIKIYTMIGNFIAYKSLASIINELPSENFIRVHKSFAIALNKVKSVDSNSIEIENKIIPIGRIYMKVVKDLIFKDNVLQTKNNISPNNTGI